MDERAVRPVMSVPDGPVSFRRGLDGASFHRENRCPQVESTPDVYFRGHGALLGRVGYLEAFQAAVVLPSSWMGAFRFKDRFRVPRLPLGKRRFPSGPKL